MKGNRFGIGGLALLGLCAITLYSPPMRAQQAPAAVPRLVQFKGVVKDAPGRPVAGVTFALYKEQEGGASVWMETQNVPLDESGRYTVLLGSTKTGGLPMELFTSGEARWLGIQPEGQPEQPRVLLFSVPYALKAADAETVGGLPPSAFMLAAPSARATTASITTASVTTADSTAATTTTVSGTGTANFVPLWSNSTTLGNSLLFQSTAGNVGINTKSPAARLDVGGGAFIRGAVTLPAITAATSTKGQNSNSLNLLASSFSSTANAPVNQKFRWQVEPTGNDTATPSGTLNLLFGQGAGIPVETGVVISSTGTVSGNGVSITGQPVNAIIGNAGCNGNFSAAIGFPTTGPLNCTNYALLGDTGGNTFLNSSAAGDIIFLNSNNSLAVLDDLGNFTLQGVGNNPGSGNLAVDRGNVTVMNGNVNISGAGHGLTFPDGTTQTTAAAGTGGTGSFGGNNTTQIVNVTQQGTGKAVNASAAGTNAIALWGSATGTSGANRGVVGGTGSGSGGIGVLGLATGTTLAPPGNGIGVSGASFYTQGIGVSGAGFVGVQGTSSLKLGMGVSGTSTDPTGYGVYATAPLTAILGVSTQTAGGSNNIGVQGFSKATSGLSYGVFGSADGPSGIGVSGLGGAPTAVGVEGVGYSSSATGNSFSDGAGVWGDTGEAGHVAVLGTADDGLGVRATNNSASFATLLAENLTNGAGLSNFLLVATAPNVINGSGLNGECVITVEGNLQCTGSKSAVVPVDKARAVALYAVEAPENWFEDFGSGTLVNGAATVTLEPVFAQTVNASVEYHVFLTPQGECEGLYVANKTAAGFEVRELRAGRSGVGFDYRIVARRKGYEAIRLADLTGTLERLKGQREDRKARASVKPVTSPRDFVLRARPTIPSQLPGIQPK